MGISSGNPNRYQPYQPYKITLEESGVCNQHYGLARLRLQKGLVSLVTARRLYG